MTSPARAIADDVFAKGGRALTGIEVRRLKRAADDDVLAADLLAMHYFNKGRFDKAAELAVRLLKLQPNAARADNAISALAKANRAREAIQLVADNPALFDDLHRANNLCQLHARLGETSEAVERGNQALALKAQQADKVPGVKAPGRMFDPSRPERNVIAFSLFGSNPRYLDGAVRNAIVARHLYPGWTPRFYVDETVPKHIVKRLKGEGAQILQVQGLPANRFGLFWRFLVEDDEAVDFYLVRDADSILNIKERAAVGAWLASDKSFHAMRDHCGHCELLLAGMWGARRGALGPMLKRIRAFVEAHQATINDRSIDQQFLGRQVWPQMRGDLLVHDSFFSFEPYDRFPEGFDLAPGSHIGANEAAVRTGHDGGRGDNS